jgi:hypothetical protein
VNVSTVKMEENNGDLHSKNVSTVKKRKMTVAVSTVKNIRR